MQITVKSSTMVKPSTETPRGSIRLSNLDLLMPGAYHSRSIACYRSDGTDNFFEQAVLESALSRGLVEFYPYAGRLKRDDGDRIEIDCNGEGALLVEAESDGALDDLGDFRPNPDLALIPAVDYSKGISSFPLLLLQVTRFKCGGVCLGIANEHFLADGVAILHIITSCARLARGSTILVPPFFDRAVLSPSNPTQPRFTHVEYQPPPPMKTPLHASETSFSIFKLTSDQVNSLKDKCNQSGSNYSTFEVISGHVWRCVCLARGLAKDQETKLHVPVDGRQRLRPRLPAGYFGNVIFSATPVAESGEIVSNPLNFVVGKVHEAIARLDDEYMRSALDYLELQGDVRALARGPHTTRCPNLGIISWVQLPVYLLDFGWGKPFYFGPGVAPYEGKSYLVNNAANDGSLLYAVTLLKEHMDLFERFFYDI